MLLMKNWNPNKIENDMSEATFGIKDFTYTYPR